MTSREFSSPQTRVAQILDIHNVRQVQWFGDLHQMALWCYSTLVPPGGALIGGQVAPAGMKVFRKFPEIRKF